MAFFLSGLPPQMTTVMYVTVTKVSRELKKVHQRALKVKVASHGFKITNDE